MKYLRSFVWLVLALLFITPSVALTQNGECSAMVQAALEATDNVCSDTSRNQACYGHARLEAIPQSRDIPFKFSEVGDRVDVSRVGSLRLSPMDLQNGIWGVALMRLQTDISDQLTDTNVTLLVFGDVELRNAVLEPKVVNAIVKGPSNANIRRQPSNRAFVIASIPPGDTLNVKGQSEDGAWLYVELSGPERNGWVRRSLLTSGYDLTTLDVIDPALTDYGPMQAFFLQNGNQQTSCDSAPNDGILIQTPEGAAKVRLWINEVKIKLGSTAFIQASPDQKMMVINMLEGAAYVEALGVEQVVTAGNSVTIRMDENLVPIAPPSLPREYLRSQLEQLPVENLERSITIAAPSNDISAPAAAVTAVPSAAATFTPSHPFTATSTQLPTHGATNTAAPLTNTASPGDMATLTEGPSEQMTVLPSITLFPTSDVPATIGTGAPPSMNPPAATPTGGAITGQGLQFITENTLSTAVQITAAPVKPTSEGTATP